MDYKVAKPSPTSHIPKYMAGGVRSVKRLKNLNYDPIGELVAKYRDLESELERQKSIREGKIVELTGTGRPKSYNPEITMTIYDKQIAIAEKLLRYRYGRVPELDEGAIKTPMPLVVNLTNKGDVYTINDELPDEDFSDEDE